MAKHDVTIEELKEISAILRFMVVDSIHKACSGHPGGSLSAADIMSVLYFRNMRIDPSDPRWPERDRFILSKGHAAPILYATLALKGYFPVEHLESLRCLGSILQGHPDMNKTPGVDMTSGSLGQGLSIGLGISLANRLLPAYVKTYVLIGDGEIQEGQIWEAAMAAAHFKTKGLIAILDYNKVQLDGAVNEILAVEPLKDKWEAFGWRVLNIDGHDIGEIISGVDEAEALCNEGPVVIIANTVKGKGVSFMEHSEAWHGKACDLDEYNTAVKEIKGCYLCRN